MQTIHIEFYGKLSDRMGTSLSCELPIQDMTIAGLREHLAKDHDYAELLKPAIRPVINDEMVQDGNTNAMLWKVDELISYVSQYFTLKKGDIIFTGTPAGVGKVFENDVLKGFIEDKEVFNIRVK